MSVWYYAIVNFVAVENHTESVYGLTSPGCDIFPSDMPCGRSGESQMLLASEIREGHRRATIASAPMNSINPLNRQADGTFLSPADAGLYSSTHSLAGRISRRESLISSDCCPGCGFPWYDCICHPQWNAKDSPSVGFSTPTTTNAHIQPGEGQTNHLSPAPIPWMNSVYHP